MNLIDIPVLIIQSDDWEVIYIKGKKHKEGHGIPDQTWIEIGMLMHQENLSILDIQSAGVYTSDVTNEELLWDFPENVNDLDAEVKNIILSNIESAYL